MLRLARSALALAALVSALACGGAATPDVGGAPTIVSLAGRWLVVGERAGKPVIDAACTAEAPSVTVTGTDALTVTEGQEDLAYRVQSAEIVGDEVRIAVAPQDGGEPTTMTARWDGPEHRRLLWRRGEGPIWPTVHEQRLGDVTRMRACCVEVEGELPEDYATVPEGQDCPPPPAP